MQEINKYPLSEKSTLLIKGGYKLPLGLMLDANFYPRCDNKPPFFIASIEKNTSEHTVLMHVNNRDGAHVFSIKASLSGDSDTDFEQLVGEQDGYYCGCCLCSKQVVDWLKSIPSIPVLSADSLVFSADVIKPIPVRSAKKVSVTYGDKQVNGISWGDHLIGGSVDTTDPLLSMTSNSSEYLQKDDGSQDIHTLYINGVRVSGDHVYITHGKNSIVRVSSTPDINIGRLNEF